MKWAKVILLCVKMVLFIAVIAGLIVGNRILWNLCDKYSNILHVAISIYVACVIFCFLFFLDDGIFYTDIPQIDNVPKSEIIKIISIARSWKFLNLIWLSTYWAMTSFPILLSILVIFSAGNTEKVILYSVVSLAMTAVSAVIRPKEQAYGYRVGFERLNGKLLLYSNGVCLWEEVLAAVNWGEKGITCSTYDTINTDL